MGQIRTTSRLQLHSHKGNKFIDIGDPFADLLQRYVPWFSPVSEKKDEFPSNLSDECSMHTTIGEASWGSKRRPSIYFFAVFTEWTQVHASNGRLINFTFLYGMKMPFRWGWTGHWRNAILQSTCILPHSELNILKFCIDWAKLCRGSCLEPHEPWSLWAWINFSFESLAKRETRLKRRRSKDPSPTS